MPKVRAETSKKGKWYLPKHRFYELYHWCLQYKEWKQEVNSLTTGESGMKRKAKLRKRIELIESTARESDEQLAEYILRAVIDDAASYDWMKMWMNIPCSPDMFYDRRRKFLWLLDKHLEESNVP